MAVKTKAEFITGEDVSKLGSFDRAIDKLEEKLKPNTEYTVYLCDKKKNRSLAANRYYWGVVIKVLEEHTGIDSEDFHEVLKFQFNKKKISILEEEQEIGESTKKMTQDQFEKYIEKIRDWALNELDCYIPLPQEVTGVDFQDLYIEAKEAKI